MKHARSARFVSMLVNTMAASSSMGKAATQDLPPEHLALASHVGGAKVSLKFSDGFICTVDVQRFGFDPDHLRMETARESWGSAVEIEDRRGKAIHIDSSVLRAACDPVYAKRLREAIAALS